ncbi:MAG: prepilin peptidase, partial [Chloroflexota bacterium]
MEPQTVVSPGAVVILAVLAIATAYDLRRRWVPAWLTCGGGAAGVLAAAWAGPEALRQSLLGLAVGGVLL